MPEIRCITVQQPWAFAITRGKNIENRSQNVRYRGLLAIHAGLRWSHRGAGDGRVMAAAVRFGDNLTVAGLQTLTGRLGSQTGARRALDRRFPGGAIIAVCELTDCHPATGCCAPWGDDEYDGKRVHHLVLERVRALETPIPCTGRLGLWRPPAEVLPLLTGGAS